MSQCDYCSIFSEIIHHLIILKYTLKCTQLNYFLNIFPEEHTLESSSNKLNSVIHTARSRTQAGFITIPLHYLKNYTPMFEHGFSLWINEHSFRLLPPDNDMVYVTIICHVSVPKRENFPLHHWSKLIDACINFVLRQLFPFFFQ